MGYEFTIDGYGLFKDEVLDDEPDVDLRVYQMGNWVAAARESWQYTADPWLRELVDKLTTELEKYEKKIEGLTAMKLELSILIDKLEAARSAHQVEMRRKYTTAYRAGQRDEGFLKMYRQVMKWDEEAGTFNPEHYGGLTPEDIC